MPKLFGVDVSEDVYAANQHLLDTPKEDKTAARKELEREIKEQFARTFESVWQLLNGPPLRKEFAFDDTRQWRSDYLQPETRVLIELEGGVYKRGRHQRPGGFIEDAIKYNEAVFQGYHLIRIPTGMATAHYLARVIEFITRLQHEKQRNPN